MRLFRLEIKRILKSRRTLVLLSVAMLLSVLMAYLPISFESINRPNEDGTITELDGLAAIEYKRNLYATTQGDVTAEKVKQALITYQDCVKQYGSIDGGEFPLEVNIEKIVPIRPLLKGVSEAFADPATGMGAELMDIEPNEVEQQYYEKCAEHLNDVMRNEQKNHFSAQQKASEKYAKVDKPFQLYAGMSKDAFDYIELYILVFSILCVAIAAPIFSNEYQTGADSILRATKHGRTRLAITKISASTTIFILAFVLGITVHLLILNMAFGTDCLKTSFQMLFSIINLPNINLGQLEIILALGGLLSMLASISCTLFLSAKCKDSLTALLVSLVIVLMPMFAYTALGASWISCIFPSAGIGMQNNLLYQLANFNYLHIGEMSFWTPYIILVSAAIEVPIFLLLAVRSYCKHQVA